MTNELIKKVENYFKSKFEETPLLVSSPGRINLIGEHTDYNEGFVFPAAIDKGIVSAIGHSTKNLCTAFAMDMEEEYEFSLDEIHPIPNGNWRNYIVGVVGELKKMGVEISPFNVVFAGNIPKGAGLSSSAALENSIVFGLDKLFDLNLSKHEMILISQKAEHNYVGVRCGIMDQYASMFGEKNHALLLDCRTQESTLFQLNFNDYGIMLINTNVSHNLVDAEYNDRRKVCEKVAEILKVNFLRDATEDMLNDIKDVITPIEYQKALYVVQENERVLKAAHAIENHDLDDLGTLLYEAHYGAQHQFKISCPELDFLVEQAKTYSIVKGARMMGGGFGGCTINIVLKAKMEFYAERISKDYYNEFDKHCSIYHVNLSQGTHLV